MFRYSFFCTVSIHLSLEINWFDLRFTKISSILSLHNLWLRLLQYEMVIPVCASVWSESGSLFQSPSLEFSSRKVAVQYRRAEVHADRCKIEYRNRILELWFSIANKINFLLDGKNISFMVRF